MRLHARNPEVVRRAQCFPDGVSGRCIIQPSGLYEAALLRHRLSLASGTPFKVEDLGQKTCDRRLERAPTRQG